MIILSFNYYWKFINRYFYHLILLSFGYSLMRRHLDTNIALIKSNKIRETLLNK